jgi:hypothetical protein
VTLTPIQIALLADAHKARQQKDEVVFVWGSWQKAAQGLLHLLHSLGTQRGSREIEWKTLHGRHRRGKEGRLMHAYALRATDEALDLAAR